MTHSQTSEFKSQSKNLTVTKIKLKETFSSYHGLQWLQESPKGEVQEAKLLFTIIRL